MYLKELIEGPIGEPDIQLGESIVVTGPWTTNNLLTAICTMESRTMNRNSKRHSKCFIQFGRKKILNGGSTM